MIIICHPMIKMNQRDFIATHVGCNAIFERIEGEQGSELVNVVAYAQTPLDNSTLREYLEELNEAEAQKPESERRSFIYNIGMTYEGIIWRSHKEKAKAPDAPMNKIASFTVNHIDLIPGLYVSRRDKVGDSIITTYDIRMTSPNDEPVMNTAEVHTIEHLGATFLRNHKDYKDRVIYFGPMGCRTGFYLLLAGEEEPKDLLPLMTEMFEFIRDFEGEVPGASPRDCGNYLDMNLGMAKYMAKRYLEKVLYHPSESNLVYPE